MMHSQYSDNAIPYNYAIGHAPLRAKVEGALTGLELPPPAWETLSLPPYLGHRLGCITTFKASLALLCLVL